MADKSQADLGSAVAQASSWARLLDSSRWASAWARRSFAFCSTVAIASAPDRGQSSVDLDARDRQRIRGCRHRNAAAAGEIAYRRVNVRCVTPLGDETASMS